MCASFGSGFWASLLREFHCWHCGGREGFVSRPRNFLERHFLGVLRLRPARCGGCYRRSWRFVTVALLPREAPMRFNPEEMMASARAADQQEARKETPIETKERRALREPSNARYT
jgi:hypothetical protein